VRSDEVVLHHSARRQRLLMQSELYERIAIPFYDNGVFGLRYDVVYWQSQQRLIGKVEDRTMKMQTKRSISGVIPLGLLTSVIAVAWLWHGAAVGGRAFAAAGGDAVTLWNANAGVAATEACLAPLANPLHESRN
jgi:hypothetical protein